MTPRVVLFAALSLLSACATRSPLQPAPAIEPQACDPRLTAPSEPEPPVTGAIIQPATETERAAVEAFLSGEAQARAWGREGWARAEIARAACGPIGSDRPRTDRRRPPG
jgi:hypothetical protein